MRVQGASAMSMRCWWVFVIATGLIVAACSSESDSSRSLDDLLGDIGEGPVSLEVALGAYAAAIGPLPGVETPVPGEVVLTSGTGPSRWVRAHWQELTPEQRSAIERYEGNPAEANGVEGGPILATVAGLGLATADDGVDEVAMLAIIDEISDRIAAKVGRPLGIEVELRIAPDLIDGTAMATATPVGSGGPWVGTPTKCVYTVTKLGIPESQQIDATGVASVALESTIAHELWHCLSFTVGDPSRIPYRSAWIEEGMAEWAGQEISGGSQPNWWGHWLLKSSDLFQRTYDASGFWAHVAENSAGLWTSALDIVVANDAGNDAAYEATLAISDPSMLTTWGPGYFRDPKHALEWDQDGAGIPPTKPPPLDFGSLADGGSMVLSANPRSHSINEVDLTAEVVVVSPTTYGMMQLPDEVNLSYPGSPIEILCTDPAGCTCPEGSPGASTIFRQTKPGITRVGLTGHTSGAEMELRGWSLAEFCEQYEPPETLDACLIGQWSSTRFTATDHVVKPGTGTGISLVVRESGEGYIDFSEHVPVILRAFPEPEAPDVQVLQEGAAWLKLVPAGPSRAQVLGGTTINFSVKGQVDLGGGWIDAGPGIQASGTSIGAGAEVVCDDEGSLRLGLPGEFTGYFFEKISDNGEIPPEPQETTPIGGIGGPGGATTGPGVEPPPPNWGLNYDACLILTAEEVAALSPGVKAPGAEDDISSQSFHQCSFLPALSVQITPPSTPNSVNPTVEFFDAQSVEIAGVIDWGRAVVDDTVIMVAGSNSRGTVTIVVWIELAPGTPQYDVLVELLTLALSRL